MSSTLKRAVVAIGGGFVLLVGILAIPYPGPGWLIVFAGLGILSTEFDWAKRLLAYARGKYDAWQDWLKRQQPAVKVGFWLLTTVVVVITIYLLNGYGLLASLFNIEANWLSSPLAR